MSPDQTRSVRATWLYTLASIVFFVGFLAALVALAMVQDVRGRWDAVLAAVVLLQLIAAAVQVRYCWFLVVGRGGGLPAPGWTIALLLSGGAVWTLSLLTPGAALIGAAALWVSACLIACLVVRSLRLAVLGAGAFAVIGHAVIAVSVFGAMAPLASPGSWTMLVFVVMMPVILLTSLWWWEIVVELDAHRRAAAQLAVAQERLRFASDLHDIQGHHLQVISLKAELAERLLDTDPASARENIHEARLIAREALEETRSLVAGYRDVAFDVELDNAREVLTAAGAVCTVDADVPPAAPAARAALASVVRESTTNILRHSTATAVTISARTTPTICVFEIVNDGVADAARSDAGSGIAGLRDRLATIGGDLHVAHEGDRFTVRATVPLAAGVVG